MNAEQTTETRPRLKPRIAPLFPLATAVASGVVADRFLVSWSTATWAVLASLAVVAAFACRRSRGIAVASVFLAWGALGGGWHHYRWSDLAADDLARGAWESPRPVWVRGSLMEVPAFRRDGGAGRSGTTRTVLRTSAISDGRRWRPASGRLQTIITGDRTDLRMGDPVTAAGSLSAIEGPLNPGETDYRDYLRAEGIRLRLSVGDPESIRPDPEVAPRPVERLLGNARSWSQSRLIDGLDPRAAPLAAALLLGRREGVDPDVNDAFARTGTTHLLAISGLHMQALAVALALLFRLAMAGPKPEYRGVLLATVAYALLVGLTPSVVRSAAMTVMICVAGLYDRCTRPANVLAFAALATLSLNPAHLFDVGCQLSFLCIAVLFWRGPSATYARIFNNL